MIIPARVNVTTTAGPLVTVPPAGCTVTLTPAGTIYVGAGTAVTTSTGAPVSAPITLAGYASSAPSTLYAVAATGTVATGVIVSNTS